MGVKILSPFAQGDREGGETGDISINMLINAIF